MAGAGQGASGIANLFQNLLKKIDRNGDFSVKIIFSSVSMSTLTDWSVEKYVNTNEPNTSSHSVGNLAWSQPEGDGYTAECDETIFVDCSSNEAEYYKDSDGGESTLRSYISFAIARLADIIYRKTEDGLNGTVHCILLALHPCQKCLFALSELMGNSLAYSGLYSSFVGDILSRDEFHFTFRWIQSLGWRFQVDYSGVFDPFKSEGTDQKGMAERVKDMEEALDGYPDERDFTFPTDFGDSYFDQAAYEANEKKWVENDPYANDPEKRTREMKNGIPYVKCDGEWVSTHDLMERHRKIVNPSVGEMEKNLEEMKAAQADRENKANRRKNTIEKARQDYAENMARRSDIEEQEINYLLAHSDTYSGYGSAQDLARARAREALKFQGIIPDSMINIPIDGHYTTDIELTAEVNRINDDVARGRQQVAQYEEAVANKKAIIQSQKLLAIQILVAIASIPFPILAIVDIGLTVYQWGDPTKASAGDNILNTAGIAFDIAGLIPYFGTVSKVVKLASKTDVHLLSNADIALANRNFKLRNSYLDEALNKLDDIFDDMAVKAQVNKSFDAIEHIQSLPNPKDVKKSLEARDLAIEAENKASLDRSKQLHEKWKPYEEGGPAPKFSGEAIPDLNVELTQTVAELGEGNSLATIRLLLTGEEAITAVLKKFETITTVYNNFKGISSGLDFINALGDLFVRGIGVGWNGHIWFKNSNANNTPLTAEEAKQREEQVKALAELDSAQKAQLEAKTALKEAKTDAERAAAQKALDDAQKRIDNVSGALGVDLDNYQKNNQTPLKPSTIDANAELDRAKDDERKAKRALRKAKTPEEKAAAQEALNNAQERKEKAQRAVDTQKAAQNAGSPNNSTTSQLIDDLEMRTIELKTLEARHQNEVGRRERALLDNQRQIAGNDALNYGGSILDVMNNSENTRILNNQYNAANLANTLGTEDYQYQAELARYNNRVAEAFNEAKASGKKDRDQHMKGVEADMAAQDLRYTIEKQKKRQQQEESKNNKQ